ncbi:hypothetical protein CCMA1212_004793 [Trichoderma ghanense]|uniref:Uncharacterized protein n=1 Tax=Trichoderma ghanense TaxID=65468 RepID=A0ABY2H6S0_9HYPO
MKEQRATGKTPRHVKRRDRDTLPLTPDKTLDDETGRQEQHRVLARVDWRQRDSVYTVVFRGDIR